MIDAGRTTRIEPRRTRADVGDGVLCLDTRSTPTRAAGQAGTPGRGHRIVAGRAPVTVVEPLQAISATFRPLARAHAETDASRAMNFQRSNAGAAAVEYTYPAQRNPKWQAFKRYFLNSQLS